MPGSGPSAAANATFLCFDFGTKTIGVAVGQSVTGTASALTELRASDGVPEWSEVQRLIDEWQPHTVVVGLPLNMDGSESELSTRARKFANRIHGRFGVVVALADERLSSFEAKGEIIEREKSSDFKRHQVDSLAARLILESWLASGP